MHRPPSVSHCVKRTATQGWTLVFFWVVGALVAATFLVDQGQWSWRGALLIAANLVVGLLEFWAWRHVPVGVLRWDAKSWHWNDGRGMTPCHLRLQLDFQHMLLVSVRCTGRPAAWLWLEKGADDPNWIALRRAVVSSDKHPDIDTVPVTTTI